jgi:hypothetical protein
VDDDNRRDAVMSNVRNAVRGDGPSMHASSNRTLATTTKVLCMYDTCTSVSFLSDCNSECANLLFVFTEIISAYNVPNISSNSHASSQY